MMERTEGSLPGDLILINQTLAIPGSQLQFRFSRSSGPGGQHVNRSETRVELLFDVRTSPSLTDEQRQHLLLRLKSHLDSDGVLHVVSSETRSQSENRVRAIARFRALLARSLRRPRARVPTTASLASREHRLASKRARSRVKKERRSAGLIDAE